MKDGKKLDASFTILIFIFLVLIGLGVYILVSLKIDDFKELVLDNKMISVVLVIEEEDKPVVTELFYYHPETKKGALLNIPEDTGEIIHSLNRVDRIDVIYNGLTPSEYLEQIHTMTGIQPDFYLTLSSRGLSGLVDYLEGVEVFLANPVETQKEGRMILLPSGSLSLDGDKALDFLNYEMDGESAGDRIQREHELVFGILRKISQLFFTGFFRQSDGFFVSEV